MVNSGLQQLYRGPLSQNIIRIMLFWGPLGSSRSGTTTNEWGHSKESKLSALYGGRVGRRVGVRMSQWVPTRF